MATTEHLSAVAWLTVSAAKNRPKEKMLNEAKIPSQKRGHAWSCE